MIDSIVADPDNLRLLREDLEALFRIAPSKFYKDFVLPITSKGEIDASMPAEEATPRATMARIEGEDLLAWSQRFLPHHFRLAPSHMHRWLCDKLTELHGTRGVRLCNIGPRGSSKSTVGSLADILNDICESREPYIILISDTATQACLLLDAIKTELTDNEALAQAYPHACGEGEVWRENSIITRNGCRIDALGTGNKIRGRRAGEHRPTKIVIDDGENDEHVLSPRRREKTRSWFDRAVMKAGAPETNIIVYGTSLQRECLVETLARRGGWEVKRWASIMAWPERMDLWADWEKIVHALRLDDSDEDPLDVARAYYELRRSEMEEGSKVLWPEREDLYALMLMRAIGGHLSFEAEKQSRPVNPENCEWPESYFADSIWVSKFPEGMTLKTIAMDPSKGRDARRGDYSAIVKLGVYKGHVYVSCNMRRRDAQEMCQGFVDACLEFKPHAAVVEGNQFQELLAAPIQDECARRGSHIPLTTIDNTTNKTVRIRRLTSWFAQGKIHFVDDDPGSRLCVDQCRDFPNGDHDDGPDAVEMALRTALELDAA
jgi:predicted phage terminase large subunit-like protein